jgi:toxin ParE1/3/4
MATRKARLTPQARTELLEAIRYIANDSPNAARGLRHVVEEALIRLGQFPRTGVRRPEWAPAPIRFLSLSSYSYWIVYDPTPMPPEVLRIIHGARDIPTMLSGLS